MTKPNPNLRICLLRREREGVGEEKVVLFFALLHCPHCFLSVSRCAEALGAMHCSLHQRSNEAVATLAAALIEPCTDSLPGGSVFQSTGPPSHPLSILPPPRPNHRTALPQHTHPRLPSNPLYNSVSDTRERFSSQTYGR